MADTQRPIARLRRRVLESPAAALVVFVATVYAAALPTIYSVLAAGIDPSTGEAGEWRQFAVPLFVVWVLCALALGMIAFLREDDLRALYAALRIGVPKDLSARRRVAVLRVIALLLEDSGHTGLLDKFEPKIFIPSGSEDVELVPLLSADVEGWERWPVEHGAVGLAFHANNDDPLVFRGAELTELNSTLTEEQLAHYAHLTLVAAIVIRDDNEDAVGVLSVSSSARPPRFGEARRRAMKLLANDLGVFVQLAI